MPTTSSQLLLPSWSSWRCPTWNRANLNIRSPSVAAGEDALKVIRSVERVGALPTVRIIINKSLYSSKLRTDTGFLMEIIIALSGYVIIFHIDDYFSFGMSCFEISQSFWNLT